MSGGSFNYLFRAEMVQEWQVEEMRAAMEEEGLTETAAYRDTLGVITALRNIDDVRDRLRDVWHAMEWYRSFDWGRDQLDEAVSKYEETAK